MLTDDERRRCIAHTLKGTFYVGMALVDHHIIKIIRDKGIYIIFEGELWLRHQQSESDIHIFIRSDAPNRDNPIRCYGYIDKVMIKGIGERKYRDSDGYEIRQMVRGR